MEKKKKCGLGHFWHLQREGRGGSWYFLEGEMASDSMQRKRDFRIRWMSAQITHQWQFAGLILSEAFLGNCHRCQEGTQEALTTTVSTDPSGISCHISGDHWVSQTLTEFMPFCRQMSSLDSISFRFYYNLQWFSFLVLLLLLLLLSVF